MKRIEESIKWKRQQRYYDLIETIQLFNPGDKFNIKGIECYINDNYNLVITIGYPNIINVFDLSKQSIDILIYELEKIAKDKGYI